MVCEQCGNDYERIGHHWVQSSSCDHPALDQLTKDILIGSLMGDGAIRGKNSKNQNMSVGWSSEEQCSWLDEQFGWLSTGVSLGETAAAAAERLGGTDIKGYELSSDPEDYSDAYLVQTRAHPFITRMTTRWYGDSGYEKKEWPDDIHLSQTVLLLWYVGDGHYADKNANRRIKITLDNEEGNEEKINAYFNRVGQPEPSRWGKSGSYAAVWSVKESKSLFEYMNQSPLMDDGVPGGFEYKFPEEYGGTGKSMGDVDT